MTFDREKERQGKGKGRGERQLSPAATTKHLNIDFIRANA
jgi:hypothetical protein